jgi:hypothetical protein
MKSSLGQREAFRIASMLAWSRQSQPRPSIPTKINIFGHKESTKIYYYLSSSSEDDAGQLCSSSRGEIGEDITTRSHDE